MFNKESEEWLTVTAECDKLRRDAVEKMLAKGTVERDTDFYRGVMFAVVTISAIPDDSPLVVETAAAPDY